MRERSLSVVVRHVYRVAGAGAPEPTDRDLLCRYARAGDESAFAEVVRRHGPLVWGVCRRVLGRHHDAEDAFQATFLVLARRAGSVCWRESAGPWLHAVAYHMAKKARRAGARRRAREAAAARAPRPAPAAEGELRELAMLLDEGLNRLAARHREPLVLCYLEGVARAEAARRLRLSSRTLDRRVAESRERLRVLLGRHGITLSAVVLAAALEQETGAGAVMPPHLTAAARAAAASVAGKAVAGPAVTAAAMALARGVATVSVVGKVGLTLGLVAGLGLVGGSWLRQSLSGEAPAGVPRMTLREDFGRRTDPDAPVVPSVLRPAFPPDYRETPPNEGRRTDLAAGKSVRADALGDPLPPEAVSRLGTVRFRSRWDGAGVLRYSRDAKTLFEEGGGSVTQWDAATGRELRRWPSASGTPLQRPDSVSADNRFLATVGTAGIQLWDIATAGTPATLASGRFNCARLSPDGQAVLCLRFWVEPSVEFREVPGGRLRWSWNPVGCRPESTAFTPDGEWVAASVSRLRGAQAGTWVVMLDARTGRERHRVELGRTERPPETWRHGGVDKGGIERFAVGPTRAHQLTVSPDGRLLAGICTSSDLTQGWQLRVWRLPDLAERLRLTPPRAPASVWADRFTAVAFTPDGRGLVTGGTLDGLVEWDLATGKERRRFGHGLAFARNLAFARDGKTLAVAVNGVVRVIDPATGEELVRTPGHEGGVFAAAIGRDGAAVTAADFGPNLIVWDGASGREQRRVQPGVPGDRFMLAADARTGFVASLRSGAVTVWDLNTGKERGRWPLRINAGDELQAVSPRGDLAAVSAGNGDVRLVDAGTGKTLWKLFSERGAVRCVTFSADGRTVAAVRTDGIVQVWDTAGGRQQARFRLPGPAGRIYTAVLAPDGRRMALILSTPWTVSIFETATGHETYQFAWVGRGQPAAIRFSSDCRTLACGGYGDGVVRLVEVATGKERHALSGHRGGVLCLAYSPEGRRLVSGSGDTTALVWNLFGPLASADGHRAPLAPDWDAAWQGLMGDDAARAYEAVRRLAATPAGVRALRERLRPAPQADGKEVALLLRGLESSRAEVREQAARGLYRLGEGATAACRVALAGRPGADARLRLAGFLATMGREEREPTGERLRAVRAVEALELAGTPAARRVLESLATGAPDARLTREAKAALGRPSRLPR